MNMVLDEMNENKREYRKYSLRPLKNNWKHCGENSEKL